MLLGFRAGSVATTIVKDVNINGQNAVGSVRSIEIRPAKMTFRKVVFWNEKEKKL